MSAVDGGVFVGTPLQGRGGQVSNLGRGSDSPGADAEWDSVCGVERVVEVLGAAAEGARGPFAGGDVRPWGGVDCDLVLSHLGISVLVRQEGQHQVAFGEVPYCVTVQAGSEPARASAVVLRRAEGDGPPFTLQQAEADQHLES